MGEYGSGVSLIQAFNYDKERLLKALDGQLLCGESGYGFMYGDASPEDCREFIISVFDNAVYHALKGYGSGKTLEKADEQAEEYHYGDPENPED